MIPNFAEYEINTDDHGQKETKKPPARSTMMYSANESKELMNSIEMLNMKKKM